ncbi:MAG: GNAT family N-acetyltransferase [Nitrospirae bacterium]|nr:GNAT family N-acetyltransferase [Nitrospirota bacterium]
MPYRFSDSKAVDIDQALELYKCAEWSKDRTREEAETILANSSLILTVWDDGRLLGMARVLTDFVVRATLYDVIVRPEVQGKGVGRMLVEKALDHPSLKRVPVFYLLTKDKRPFYERFGFVSTRDRGLEAMILVRDQSYPPVDSGGEEENA